MSNNLSARYYQEYKEILQEKLMKDSKIFLQNKKKKCHYGCERYKNLSEDEKNKLVEKKKSYKIRKNCFL